MDKIVKIDGKECLLRTNAALPRLYRLLLRRELFDDMGTMLRTVASVYQAQTDKKAKAPNIKDQLDMLTLVENIAFAMHKNGDAAQPNTVEEWLAQFEDEAALMEPDLLAAITDLWNHETETTSTEKKKKEQSTGE